MNTEYPSHDRRFFDYIARVPIAWTLYRRFANELYQAGRTRGSSEHIIQRIRWETDVNPNLYQGFKISNNHRRRFALLLAETDPRFANFFRFRGQA